VYVVSGNAGGQGREATLNPRISGRNSFGLIAIPSWSIAATQHCNVPCLEVVVVRAWRRLARERIHETLIYGAVLLLDVAVAKLLQRGFSSHPRHCEARALPH
jgi:hypothetical protein